MTGFGRAEAVYEGKKVLVEIKSLNSKSMDLSMRVAMRYKEKEYELRKLITDRIIRGKVDCFVQMESLDESGEVRLCENLIQSYMEELKKLASDGPEFEYLKMAVRMPDAVSTKTQELDGKEWDFLQDLTSQALDSFVEFREKEGATLSKELLQSLSTIRQLLSEVTPYENERLVAVKERYQNTLKEFENVDQTRFYQELAYYTEKLDISEEKVRLEQHLNYYEEVLQKEKQNGKKLGFIAQEMGREINTLGSKANHAEIQQLVVRMKDDLEKIKEQTLNVL